MPSLILASDLTSRLTRLNAELTRRNGYTSLAGNTQSFPTTDPVAGGNKAIVTAINTLFTGLRFINGTNVPSDRVSLNSLMLESDLIAIDNLLTAFEAKSRTATSGSDCAAACSGTCVTTCSGQCTGCTGCTGCGSSCASGCTGCYGGCLTGCKSACALACNSNCSSSCQGCTASCKGSCKGNYIGYAT